MGDFFQVSVEGPWWLCVLRRTRVHGPLSGVVWSGGGHPALAARSGAPFRNTNPPPCLGLVPRQHQKGAGASLQSVVEVKAACARARPFFTPSPSFCPPRASRRASTHAPCDCVRVGRVGSQSPAARGAPCANDG